jgi:LysM repeat protein
MKKKNYLFIILAILLISSLVACTRSASQPSTEPAKEAEGSEDATGTLEPMGVLEGMATQTAAAQEAGAEGGEEASGEGEAVVEEETAEEPSTGESAEAATEEEATTAEEETAAEPQQEEEPAPIPETFDVPNKYIIQAGDHLYCIARRFDIDISALLSVNGFNVNSNVYPGTELVIPKDSGGFLGNRVLRDHPTDYTVVAGDTINSIACYFGDVDPRAIEAANGLTGDYVLTPGQILDIP